MDGNVLAFVIGSYLFLSGGRGSFRLVFRGGPVVVKTNPLAVVPFCRDSIVESHVEKSESVTSGRKGGYLHIFTHKN